jgi:hypothetical protein
MHSGPCLITLTSDRNWEGKVPGEKHRSPWSAPREPSVSTGVLNSLAANKEPLPSGSRWNASLIPQLCTWGCWPAPAPHCTPLLSCFLHTGKYTRSHAICLHMCSCTCTCYTSKCIYVGSLSCICAYTWYTHMHAHPCMYTLCEQAMCAHTCAPCMHTFTKSCVHTEMHTHTFSLNQEAQAPRRSPLSFLILQQKAP